MWLIFRSLACCRERRSGYRAQRSSDTWWWGAGGLDAETQMCWTGHMRWTVECNIGHGPRVGNCGTLDTTCIKRI